MFRICKKIKKTVKCVHDDDDDDSGENYRLVPVIPGHISNILDYIIQLFTDFILFRMWHFATSFPVFDA